MASSSGINSGDALSCLIEEKVKFSKIKRFDFIVYFRIVVSVMKNLKSTSMKMMTHGSYVIVFSKKEK